MDRVEVNHIADIAMLRVTAKGLRQRADDLERIAAQLRETADRLDETSQISDVLMSAVKPQSS